MALQIGDFLVPAREAIDASRSHVELVEALHALFPEFPPDVDADQIFPNAEMIAAWRGARTLVEAMKMVLDEGSSR